MTFIPNTLISGAELQTEHLNALLSLAADCKQQPAKYQAVLANKHVLTLFDKPSLRTRLSFAIAVQSLGGNALESIQATRKHEEPEDLIRVIQGYCDALIMRTYHEDTFYRMQPHSSIPIINGLSDNFHPCQILADLLTLKEQFSKLAGLNIAYIGDGNNILHSLLLMAPKLGITVHYCCPPQYQPNSSIVANAITYAPDNSIQSFSQPFEAVKHCHAVYTDVWSSMGFATADESHFAGFQVNEALMEHAESNAVFMHCLPMERGKEISTTLPEQPYSIIFQQSANRLHAQKALLINLFNRGLKL